MLLSHLTALLLALCATPDSAVAADTADAPAALSERQIAARDWSFMGVALGVDQRVLRAVVRSARKMGAAEALAGGRFVDTEHGEERWAAAGGLSGAVSATFDFLDSTLYAMSWLREGDRKVFGTVRDSLVERLGTSRLRHGNTYTWIFLGVKRRIELDYQPMVGIRTQVVDEALVRRLRSRQVE